jgi:hypothetical protein
MKLRAHLESRSREITVNESTRAYVGRSTKIPEGRAKNETPLLTSWNRVLFVDSNNLAGRKEARWRRLYMPHTLDGVWVEQLPNPTRDNK